MENHWNDFQPSAKRHKGDTYTFASLPEKASEETPDILQTSNPEETRSKTVMVAETTFFNQQNKDFLASYRLSHLRPTISPMFARYCNKTLSIHCRQKTLNIKNTFERLYKS